MDLTIKEIKEKQDKLKKDITNLLDQFYEETNIKVKGEIFGFSDIENKSLIGLKYDNPFM